VTVADSAAFELVCEELEQRSSLGRLEARGTVRLALKQAGLDAAKVMVQQMTVVLREVLPRELETRGLGDPASLCEALAERLSGLDLDADIGDTPEAVFGRLAPS
jgi:hypothetical protein